jgi:hypothetical protein
MYVDVYKTRRKTPHHWEEGAWQTPSLIRGLPPPGAASLSRVEPSRGRGTWCYPPLRLCSAAVQRLSGRHIRVVNPSCRSSQPAQQPEVTLRCFRRGGWGSRTHLQAPRPTGQRKGRCSTQQAAGRRTHALACTHVVQAALPARRDGAKLPLLSNLHCQQQSPQIHRRRGPPCAKTSWRCARIERAHAARRRRLPTRK